LLDSLGHPLDGYTYQNDSWDCATNITRQLGLTPISSRSVMTASANWPHGRAGIQRHGAAERATRLRLRPANNLQYRTNGAMAQTFNVNSLNEISSVTRSGAFTVTGHSAPAASVTVTARRRRTMRFHVCRHRQQPRQRKQ